MRTAVIITGNPDLVAGNPRAAAFYQELAAFLEQLGYAVTTDPGAPHTVPPDADLWVGHSRGADRLRFAPPTTRVIGIGVPEHAGGNPFTVINHPEDAMVRRTFADGAVTLGEGMPDDTYHYVLDEDMKARLRAAL